MAKPGVICLPIEVLWIVVCVLDHSDRSVPWVVLDDVNILDLVINVDVIDVLFTLSLAVSSLCFDFVLFDPRKWVCCLGRVWHLAWLAVGSDLSIWDVLTVFLGVVSFLWVVPIFIWVIAIFLWINIFLGEITEEILIWALCWLWFSPGFGFLEQIIAKLKILFWIR